MPLSPVKAIGAPSLRPLHVGAAMAGFNPEAGDILASPEAVSAHMQRLRSAEAEVEVEKGQGAEMEEFLRWQQEALRAKQQTLPLPAVAPEPQLFAQDEIDTATVTTTVQAGGRRRRNKRDGLESSGNVPPPSIIPNMLVKFIDEGREQTIRVHAVVRTHDGQGLAILTQVSRENRYFPRPGWAVEISTAEFGSLHCYCHGFHCDFLQHGMGLSTFALLTAEQAAAVNKQNRLEEARELLAQG